MDAASNGLEVRRDGTVWTLVLDRPERRNALTRALVTALAETLDELDADPQARVAVLAARGPAFCAGMDLAEFGSAPAGPWTSALGPVTRRRSLTPLVAAVDGPAVAGGFELLLCADVVVASTAAHFSLPEVRRGLVAAEGGLLRLGERLPSPEVRRLALTGDLLTAERAHALGFVGVLTEPGRALEAAYDVAAQIAAAAPLAVRVSKQILDETPGWAAADRWARHDDLAGVAVESDDAREGARAFLERREPRWTGR